MGLLLLIRSYFVVYAWIDLCVCRLCFMGRFIVVCVAGWLDGFTLPSLA